MQDLNDMLYFAEVAERGGFAAGRRLGLPKSRLSRRVAELESKLGVRLLQRTTRKLSLLKWARFFCAIAAPCATRRWQPAKRWRSGSPSRAAPCASSSR